MTQVRQWAAAAARQAVIADAEDTEYLVATVEGCPGAWAYGTTAEDAVAYLESVLIAVGVPRNRTSSASSRMLPEGAERSTVKVVVEILGDYLRV